MNEMKVAIINKSDSHGGAAVVSLRLAHALRDEGIDVKMLVVDKATDDPLVERMGSALTNKLQFIAERAQIMTLTTNVGRNNLFKIDTGQCGVNLLSNRRVRDADVVVLNWVNQGTVSLKTVKKLAAMGKPIVWTMHDMWNCTGVCHHAMDCRRYTGRCERCPLTGGADAPDLSTLVQIKKKEVYQASNIHFVAVSRWLERKCRESSLMRGADISVIFNAFPVNEYRCDKIAGSVPADKKVIVMGARRLDEEIKGFDQVIAMSEYVARENSALATRLHLLLYGDLRDKSLLSKLKIDYTYLGEISGNQALNNVYRNADIVLSTSQFENLPGTLIEGQASGCLPVTYGNGGQDDIVTHLYNGYIARHGDVADLVNGIEWAVNSDVDREELHRNVEVKFGSSRIARQYIELFEKTIKDANGIIP